MSDEEMKATESASTATHDIFVAYKGGASSGPIPAAYNKPDGASKLVRDFGLYLQMATPKQTYWEYHLGQSVITIDFRDVSSIHLVARS